MAWKNVLSVLGLWNGGAPVPIDASAPLPVSLPAGTIPNPMPVTVVAPTTLPVTMSQFIDTGNTKIITAADATPSAAWVGAASPTRSVGVVGILLSIIAPGQSIGGTYTFEFSEDGTTWPISISTHVNDFSTIRFRPLLNAGAFYRTQFKPDVALGAGFVVLTSQFARQDDPDFVVTAGHVFEEDDAAFGQTFAFLKGYGPDKKSRNIRADDTGALDMYDRRLIVSASGSLFVENIRDDISCNFSRDKYATEGALRVQAVSSQNGTITQNATEGRAHFATGVGANRVCYYRTIKKSIYEAGHEIIGEQTTVVPALTANQEVRWGYMEDNGSAAILNGVGWGLDATGVFVWRIKNSVEVMKVRQTAFNRDKLNGVEPSLFRRASLPVAYQPTMNTLSRVAYEWLGVSSPLFKIQSPGRAIIEAHVDETSNSQTGTTFPEPSMPLAIRIFNGSPGTDLAVESGSWRGGLHTAKTIDEPSSAGDTGQLDVGLSADVVAPGAIEGRHAIRLKNLSSSARPLYFGFTGGVTVSNGDELAVGESIELDLGPGVGVYVICASTGGGGVRCAWTQIS